MRVLGVQKDNVETGKRAHGAQVDRHKYVKVAYHGFRKLSKQERQAAYASGLQRLSFTGDDYTTIDTLFSLAEVGTRPAPAPTCACIFPCRAV